MRKLLFSYAHCTVNFYVFVFEFYKWFSYAHCTVNNSDPHGFAFFLFSLCFSFWIFIMIFLIYFCRFHLLILVWLKIWFYNLFPFILPFYKVSNVCVFIRVTRVALVHEFDVVFFFNWTWLFYRLFFFI